MAGRFRQWTLIAATLGSSWLLMQAVHELGHVLAGHLCGETVIRVVLHPLQFSRTDVTHARNPLIVVWGGPVFGVFLPLAIWAVARFARLRQAYLLRFFAGFCLIANGAYIGAGWLDKAGDAGDLLRYGAPPWTLIGFGLICAAAGLLLWNGLGPHFGLGNADGAVDKTDSTTMLAILVVTVVGELLVVRLTGF